jgi:hypothetical protein
MLADNGTGSPFGYTQNFLKVINATATAGGA